MEGQYHNPLGGEGLESKKDKVKEVECVIIIPATPGPKLRDTLQ